MSVRLSPRARGDLSRIWDDSAERYIRLLAGGFDRLAEDPARGLRADEIRKGYFRLSVGSHVLFYRLGADGGIEVIRILHGRMDFKRHL
ncbi:type II toxin-antitoxin system RelE/ParE family toxin [Methylorubrum extorquens]|uniref:type II toxin-antitoxin system RelE/ParE family toxin n=1 Tax=Methylorubrum extorquens TaxID=408 RepID=UPI00209D4B3F|nr:type II toxin-antitoxin system RelE/ParE family toxin [Methylorubrum extorquens]MCP1535986.1 toxin ParE1/3/4 [Methylorubrum extorquens]